MTAAPLSSVLLRLLRAPETAGALSGREWEDVIWQARVTRLDGRLWHRLERAAVLDAVPTPVKLRLHSGFLAAVNLRRRMLWEIDRVQWALRDQGLSIILLKGAAYARAVPEVALGRPVADLDIMLPPDELARAEATLLERGWEPVIFDEYDQRYYRRWMHELPPLRHKTRFQELDLHHAILPRTSRLPLDMTPIYAATVATDAPGLRVLSPPDMVLHCVVHLFHDGAIRGALRDLADCDALLRHFAQEPGFWNALLQRSRLLGLGRPLFYALRYAATLLGTPVPAAAMAEAAKAGPGALVLAFMDQIMPRALLPARRGRERLALQLSGFCLYIRSHWLRMALMPLLLHLGRKSWRRWKLRESEA